MLKPIELADLLERYERFLIHYAVGIFRLLGDHYPSIESRLLGIIKGTAFPVPIDVCTRHLERLSDPELIRRKAVEGLLERYRLHRTLLAFIGDGVSPALAERPLVEMTEKGEASERAFAIVTLAGQGQTKARETLLAEFESWSRALRWGTIIILDALGGIEWQPLFQANLEDAEPDVARVAIAAIGRTGTASASAKLQSLLGHASETIVIAAIQALAQLRDPHVVPALKELARTTTNHRIRATIMSAFGDFQDATTMGPLLEAFDSSDPRTRANAVLGVKRRLLSLGHPDEAIVARLKAMLADPDHRVRADTAQALWELGHQDGLPVIAAMLKSPAEPDRTSGAYLCGKLKLTQFTDQLAALTDDHSWNVRKTAALALLALGPNGLLVLQTLMQHGTPDQQVCAAYATGLAEDPDGFNALMAQSRSGTEMAEMATDLLLRLARPTGGEIWADPSQNDVSPGRRPPPSDQPIPAFGPTPPPTPPTAVDRPAMGRPGATADETPDQPRASADLPSLSEQPAGPSLSAAGSPPSRYATSPLRSSTEDLLPVSRPWEDDPARLDPAPPPVPQPAFSGPSPGSPSVDADPDRPADPDLPVSER